MHILNRAIESAEERLKQARNRLMYSHGNEQTIAKKQNRVEVAELILNTLLEKKERIERNCLCIYCYGDLRNGALYQAFGSPSWAFKYCPMCGAKLDGGQNNEH